MKKEIFNRYATEVAKEFHLTLDEMFEGTRSRECVDARFLLYYLCMERPIRPSYIQKYLKENRCPRDLVEEAKILIVRS